MDGEVKSRDIGFESDAKRWEKQFEIDAKAGKFDTMAQQAISDFNKGKCAELRTNLAQSQNSSAFTVRNNSNIHTK